MSPEINIINPSLNQIESEFGVIFNRNKAAITAKQDQFNDTWKFAHLMVDTWIIPEIAPNKHIISCLAIIKPDNTTWGTFPNVLVRNGNTYNFAEMIDSASITLGTYPCLLNEPKPLDPISETLFIEPSIHIESIQKDAQGNITIKGTLDVHFNFISWDIYHFEQTFNL
jgi:hypothetical protein